VIFAANRRKFLILITWGPVPIYQQWSVRPDGVKSMQPSCMMQSCGACIPMGRQDWELSSHLQKVASRFEATVYLYRRLRPVPYKQRVQLWNSIQRVVRECQNTRLPQTGRPQIRTQVGDHLLNEA